MDTTLPRLWTAQDVAIWLSCPTRLVIRWAKAGKLPSMTLPDGEFVFDPVELSAWLTKRRAEGPADVAE
jgi:hypothetical protein